ncbi:hypothetical protein ACN077_24830 [Clostridium chromiireducens]|uniref:hypothetical protein n=1 Tax=Clostridium chromiireducens TaxID=225345 RepID=UPI003AF9FB66
MKRNIIVALLLVAVSIVGIGIEYSNKTTTNNISNNVVATNASNNEQSDDVINVQLKADSIKNYDSVESLKKDAEIIVKGTVLDTNSYMSGPGVITEYKLKVSKSYNNKAQVGDILTIATAGGTVSYNEYAKNHEGSAKKSAKNISTEKLQNAKVKVKFDGNDLIEEGKEYVIFANTKKVLEGEKEKEMYCSLNISAGQFEINDNKGINKTLKYNKNIETLEKEIKE